MPMIRATIRWQRIGVGLESPHYSRAHSWSFDGETTVRASSSPDIVPVPMSDPTAVDPEEAFVASLSSCHMLWFLAIAAKSGWNVDEYVDDACGEMSPNDEGKMWISVVKLRPSIRWSSGSEPSVEQVSLIHHEAHDACFIANSVRTEIVIEA